MQNMIILFINTDGTDTRFSGNWPQGRIPDSGEGCYKGRHPASGF